MKTFIYWNLHKHTWSIKALQGPNKGRVVGHCDTIVIRNPEFRIGHAGRKRVIAEKTKNVHAGIVGEIGALFERRARAKPGTMKPSVVNADREIA